VSTFALLISFPLIFLLTSKIQKEEIAPRKEIEAPKKEDTPKVAPKKDDVSEKKDIQGSGSGSGVKKPPEREVSGVLRKDDKKVY